VSGTIHQWFSVKLRFIKKVFWPDSLQSSFFYGLCEKVLDELISIHWCTVCVSNFHYFPDIKIRPECGGLSKWNLAVVWIRLMYYFLDFPSFTIQISWPKLSVARNVKLCRCSCVSPDICTRKSLLITDILFTVSHLCNFISLYSFRGNRDSWVCIATKWRARL
jgi:hypothetical protein